MKPLWHKICRTACISLCYQEFVLWGALYGQKSVQGAWISLSSVIRVIMLTEFVLKEFHCITSHTFQKILKYTLEVDNVWFFSQLNFQVIVPWKCSITFGKEAAYGLIVCYYRDCASSARTRPTPYVLWHIFLCDSLYCLPWWFHWFDPYWVTIEWITMDAIRHVTSDSKRYRKSAPTCVRYTNVINQSIINTCRR